MDLLVLNDSNGKAENDDGIISGIKQRKVTLIEPSRSEENVEYREKDTGTKPKKLLKAESAKAGVDNFEYSKVVNLWKELQSNYWGLSLELRKLNAKVRDQEELSEEFKSELNHKYNEMACGVSEYEVLLSDPKALDLLESLGGDSNRKLSSFQRILAIAEKHLGGPVGEYSRQAFACGSDSGSYQSLKSGLSTSSRT